MYESTQSPGPWQFITDRYDGDQGAFFDAHGFEVCDFGSYGEYSDSSPGEPPNEANIRLIEASPKMLEALKAIDEFWLSAHPEGPYGDSKHGLGFLSEDTLALWRKIRDTIVIATVNTKT